jgi:hypothetical protein
MLIISANEEGRQISSTKGRQNKLRCPALPTYVPANLKALIETLDNAKAEQVADLVRCYYSQRAQLAGAMENFNQSNQSTITVSKTINFNPVFKDTLELYLRANGMLRYARGETEHITGTFDPSEVLNGLKVLNLEHVISPEGKEYCLRFLSDEQARARGRILSQR